MCVAEGLKARGIHLHPDSTPTKCAHALHVIIALQEAIWHRWLDESWFLPYKPCKERQQASGGACRITKDDDGMFTVHYKSKEGESTVRAGKVMFGTGRKPNTKGIGLEVGAFFKQLENREHLSEFACICG